MTEAIVPLKHQLEVKTKDELAAAKAVLTEVDERLQQTMQHAKALKHGFARIGKLLNDIEENKYYREVQDCESMGDYMELVSEKFDMGPRQLYAYRSVVDALLPTGATEEQINDMGINKAGVLARAVKVNPKAASTAIVAAAIKSTTTADDLNKLLFTKHKVPVPEKGTWFNLFADGFYATPEAAATIRKAYDRTLQELNLPEGSQPWQQRAAVLEAWAQEALASFGGK